jgi:hypothetical protein
MPAGAIGSVWTAGSWADDCWEAGTWADASAGALPFVGDMNTRYMNELTTGDRNQKWHQLVQDATDAMA